MKEIIHWAQEKLLFLGYKLNSKQPEAVQNTPWSYVLRFDTSDGYVYLKHMPKQLALEATITKLLHERFHASVPVVIADNTELDCFLMKDAGQPLRAVLKQQFDVGLICKAIDHFTLLQLEAANHIQVFLKMGVPDWRLDILPNLYNELLAEKELLMQDGLTKLEITVLETLAPTVTNLCKTLSAYAIKETLVQPDFHDNNLLIDDALQTITMIDLGEIIITHPFFSLLNCLRQIKKHHGIKETEDAFQQIRNACLKNYLNYYTKEQVAAAFEAADCVLYVFGMLGQHRLMRACGTKRIITFQPERLSSLMREFIEKCAKPPHLL